MLSRKHAKWDAVSVIEEGEHVSTVCIDGYAKALGFGGLDDIWDEDGDSIQVHPDETYQLDGTPPIQVVFPQGIDPRLVARMLRKMAGMFEGADGKKLVNLGLLVDRFDRAARAEDGAVLFGNTGSNAPRDEKPGT